MCNSTPGSGGEADTGLFRCFSIDRFIVRGSLESSQIDRLIEADMRSIGSAMRGEEGVKVGHERSDRRVGLDIQFEVRVEVERLDRGGVCVDVLSPG